MNTSHCAFERKNTVNSIKKGAHSSSEDECAPFVGIIPGARKHTLLFGNPAVLFGQDPWLCVTRSLWLCPFGERFFID
jgi:hypothetical protein